MIFTSQKIKGYTLQLALTEKAQSVAENTTELAYTLTLVSTNIRFSDYGVGATLKIDGAVVASRDRYTQPRLSIGHNSTLTLLSGSCRVRHEDIGTKTVSVGFSIDMATDDWTPGSISVSGKSMTLTPLTRESTAAATDGVIGGVSVITVNRKNAAYTHTVGWKFGALSGYIGQDWEVTDTPQKLTDTGIAFTLPEDFYYQIPNSAYGQCLLTVTTYQGEQVVGSPRQCSFRVQADASAAPMIGFSVADDNETTVALTGDATKLVRFFSTPLATVTASGKFGATIEKKVVDGVSFNGDSVHLPPAEGAAFTATVTDSRGFTATATANCTSVPYSKLTAVGACRREDPTADVVLTVSGSWFGGSFGAEANHLSLTCAVDGGEEISLTPQTDGDSYLATLVLSELDYQKAHSVVITAQDALMQVTKTVTVKQGTPIFDWGEKDFAFHVPVNLNGVHARRIRVWDGERSFFFQSKFSAFGEAGARQSVLLCGTANDGNPILGVLVINSAGVCTWTGTGNITAQKADDNGGITVTLPTGAFDDFLTITMI